MREFCGKTIDSLMTNRYLRSVQFSSVQFSEGIIPSFYKFSTETEGHRPMQEYFCVGAVPFCVWINKQEKKK